MDILQKMKHCGTCIVISTVPSRWKGLIPGTFIYEYHDKAEVRDLIAGLLERQHIVRTIYRAQRSGVILDHIPSADLAELTDVIEQSNEHRCAFYSTDEYTAIIFD